VDQGFLTVKVTQCQDHLNVKVT